jgi:D-beta-D-heptose 7-phosphate kinase/D-beta-D-heptose 1-phosphate adenosyltransferase
VAQSSAVKIKTLKNLLRLRAAWAKQGKKVVFTNGVYDILHPSHVELLEKARSMGDVLVLGLNSDSSVRMLGKGPLRPLNRWKDRALVLCALSCVDAVVSFSQETPRNLIKALRPDVLVKGGDYALRQVAGREFAAKTVLIPLKKGYSTTSLVDRIRRAR